ncbi:hypothetical protein BAY59_38545 (plasmid) [Prauserella coralliicola]|nr:hypothetical protein BAY59_38545 [Prauserella coralliicola]
MSSAPDGGPDKEPPGRERWAVDLAADVRKTRGEVHALRNTVVDLASTVSEWGPHLEDTQRDVAELRGQVDELLESPEIKNAPVDWFKLPAEDAEREWPKLAEFVHEVLGGWYEVTREQLPDCWALHRPAFLQVAWLRTSHIEAYLERSHPAQAAEFNVRWLDAALEKIKRAIPDSRCRALAGRPGEHLVDRLAAQQRRDPVSPPVPAATSASPYPNPYAQGGGQHPAQLAAQAQPAAGSAAGGDPTRAAGNEVIRWEYWGDYFHEAMRADLAWRREREAQQANAEQAADQGGEKAP